MVLDYWVEETDRVWVKIPTLRANDKIFLNIKKTAGYTPNGSNTFKWFNDFSDSNPFNTGTVASGYYHLKRRETDYDCWSYPNVYTEDDFSWTVNGFRVLTRSKSDGAGNTRYYVRFFGYDSSPTVYGDTFNMYYDAYGDVITYSRFVGATAGATDSISYSFSHSSSYETWETTYDGDNNYQTFRAGTSVATSTLTDSDSGRNSNFNRFGLLVHGSGDSNYMDFDWVAIAQKASTEPTITVTDMTSYYEVAITNNTSDTFTDFAVPILGSDLGTVTSSESLDIRILSGPLPIFRQIYPVPVSADPDAPRRDILI